ncbi:hypothetical protein [Kytococcus sp. Marseille-QA3725]
MVIELLVMGGLLLVVPGTVVLVSELVSLVQTPAPPTNRWIAPLGLSLSVLCGLAAFVLLVAGFLDTGPSSWDGLMATFVLWPAVPIALGASWLWARLGLRRRWVLAIGAVLLSVIVLWALGYGLGVI